MAHALSIRPSERSFSRNTLNPVLRAWSLGLLSATSPAIISVLVTTLKGKLSSRDASDKLKRILQRQLQHDKFPALCAYLVSGATILPIPFLALLGQLSRTRPRLAGAHARLSVSIKFLCAFVSAWVSFGVLNRRDASEIQFPQQRARSKSDVTFQPPPPPRPRLSGRTLDLTIFGAIRAFDTCVTVAWSKWRASKGKKELHAVQNYAAPILFATSSAIVMWNWFYTPNRLPSSYNKWISAAAQVDGRLIEALRQCRYGDFVYGVETGIGKLLGGMCRDMNMPESWGNPAISIPIPCEVVHTGSGKNCEWHAISRFGRAWKFAMRMYLPINLLILLRRPRAQRDLGKAVYEASQSSAFLGMFVALFYYGVCLARSRIGSRIKRLGPMDLDGGLAVGTGCLLCGWSILLEKPARRHEISFFVAPRALATLFPRRYERQHMWREQLAFACSAAVILTAAQTRPEHVRGVFGRLLGGLFA